MHANVTIATDAFHLPGTPDPAALTLHRALVRRLRAHGRMVFASDADQAEVLRAIRSGPGVPPQARVWWTELLVTFAKEHRSSVRRPSGIPLQRAGSLDELRASWQDSADVAVVSAAACPALGIDPGEELLAGPAHRPDIATITTAADTPALERLRALAEKGSLSHDHQREDFRREVLEPIAAGARAVTLVDRYYFSKLWDAADSAGHVAWLLGVLDGVMAPGARVHLISEERRPSRRQPAVSAADTATALYAAWAPPAAGNLGEVTLTLLRPTTNKAFPHDRHIRFDTGAALMMLSGFDRMEGPAVTDPHGMNWTFCWAKEKLDELRATERLVLNLPHTPAVVLTR